MTSNIHNKSSPSHHHDRHAELQASLSLLEVYNQVENQRRWQENDLLTKLYARYLQWEWLAIQIEKTIQWQTSTIRDQLKTVKQTYQRSKRPHSNSQTHSTSPSSLLTTSSALFDWKRVYLAPVEASLLNLEKNQSNLKHIDNCLEQLQNAKVHLEQLKNQVSPTDYQEQMNELDDCIGMMKDVVSHRIDSDYYSLLDSL
ncbi:uncharacterized protein BX664DRAFT_319329 [Halteromyces radiatus]|uniref:uncharacterized protein n=1 Tax=Halteromyces radiatus TaxID=101107 RepID=UPI0022200ED9|nr:uncharacterized protein BX664DRAFT_319329 [Halteromyces radiatus]KAI8098678.1 hypothetical protein BX664DRAFT_319329 [Halteromyces radiatus]